MENLSCARCCSVFTEYLGDQNKRKFLSSGHLLLVKSEKLKKYAIGWEDSTHLYDVTDIDWCSDCTIGWEDSTHLYGVTDMDQCSGCQPSSQAHSFPPGNYPLYETESVKAVTRGDQLCWLCQLKWLSCGICLFRILMWDSSLYAVNMFYYYWLIKNLLWPMAGQNKARQEIQTEIYRESEQNVEGDVM